MGTQKAYRERFFELGTPLNLLHEHDRFPLFTSSVHVAPLFSLFRACGAAGSDLRFGCCLMNLIAIR